jgi:hypothetical protein
MKDHPYRYGFRNNYRGNMPLTEMLLKDVIDFFKSLYYRFHHKGELPTIVVYPDFPSKKTTIYKIAKALKYRLTNKPVEANLVIYFEDTTIGDTTNIERYYGNRRILNGACRDISKQKVDATHLTVLGYNTFIDPTKYVGSALSKSDDNAKHDGQAISCPIDSPDPSKIYQIIIDNTMNAEEVVDMRVPVYGSHIPLVYQKYKRMNVRYTNEVHRTTLHRPDELLSANEQDQIIAFAKMMGADWCELDVLRHRGDGKIYIVDLNKTAYGPPAELPQKEEAVALLTASFRNAFV